MRVLHMMRQIYVYCGLAYMSIVSYTELVTDSNMALPVRHKDKRQLNVWLHKDVKEALLALAALSGLSVTACLEALIRDAQKKAGV